MNCCVRTTNRRHGPRQRRLRLSRYGAGLNEDFAYPPSPAGFIGLTQWRPDLSLFPLPIWRKLVMRRLRSAAPELFDYADSPRATGRCATKLRRMCHDREPCDALLNR